MLDEEANIHGVELPPPHAPPPDLETTPPDALVRDEEDHWAPPIKVNFFFAFGTLTLMTALAGVTAEWLVDSIDGLTETSGVSREFVGLVLLPGKLSVRPVPCVVNGLHALPCGSGHEKRRTPRSVFQGGGSPPNSLPTSSLFHTITSHLCPTRTISQGVARRATLRLSVWHRSSPKTLPSLENPLQLVPLPFHPSPLALCASPGPLLTLSDRKLGRTHYCCNRLREGQIEPLDVDRGRVVDPGLALYPPDPRFGRLGDRTAHDALLRHVRDYHARDQCPARQLCHLGRKDELP